MAKRTDEPAFCVVVAADEAGCIGREGALPWRLPGDMAYFKQLTTDAPAGRQNAVLMGRKTYESIPAKFRPLPGRLNVVLSRKPNLELPLGVLSADSLDAALAAVKARDDVARLFVIGGAELYRTALEDPRCRVVYLTRVHAKVQGDAYFPALSADFRRVSTSPLHEEGALAYTFEVFERAAR